MFEIIKQYNGIEKTVHLALLHSLKAIEYLEISGNQNIYKIFKSLISNVITRVK